MAGATLPTVDELKKLPLRGIVAYTVRCARRVQPLYGQARGTADFEEHKAAIETALTIAEQLCQGEPITADVTRAAFAAAAAVATAAADAAANANAAAADALAAFAAAARVADRAAFAADRAADDAIARVADDAHAAAHYAAAVAAAADRAAFAAVAAAAASSFAAAANPAFAADIAAKADYDRLVSLNLGECPDFGQPIDPTENGPLGPLWPQRPRATESGQW